MQDGAVEPRFDRGAAAPRMKRLRHALRGVAASLLLMARNARGVSNVGRDIGDVAKRRRGFVVFDVVGRYFTIAVAGNGRDDQKRERAESSEIAICDGVHAGVVRGTRGAALQ